MQMYIAGKWVDKAETMDVINPYDGSVIDTVPKGDPSDVEAAIASAERGAKVMAAMSAYERYEIIHKASDIMLERLDDLGRTITLEEGKVLADGDDKAKSGLPSASLRRAGSSRSLSPPWSSGCGGALSAPR